MNRVRGSRGSKRYSSLGDQVANAIENRKQISATELVREAAKYSECSEMEDKSLTRKLYLRVTGKTLLNRGIPFDRPLTTIRETKKGRKYEGD